MAEELTFHLGPSFLVQAALRAARSSDCFSFLVRDQLVGQQLLQRLGGQMALEHAADGDGDRAVFLRHDDDHGVGDLAGADARAVARAEVAGQVRIVAQGHHAARGRDAAAADDDRAVVQGRIFEKQVAQQLLGQLRVDDACRS